MIRRYSYVIFLSCAASLMLLLGSQVCAQTANTEGTGASYQPAPKDIVTRAKAHTELGSLYFQDGNWIVALEELTIATGINPDYAPAYSIRGLVLYYVKEWESADKDFRKALSLNDRDPEVNNNYGWFLCQTDRAKEAIPYFENAIASPMYRTPEIAFLNLGMCRIKLGELDQAEADIIKSLRLSPGNPQAYFSLAQISYQRGNYDAAKNYLSTLVSMNDPGAQVLWLALRIERRLGDRVAQTNLEAQLRRIYPDSPEYEQFRKGNFE